MEVDEAIHNVLAMIRANVKPEDALKLAEAALKLVCTKEMLRSAEISVEEAKQEDKETTKTHKR